MGTKVPLPFECGNLQAEPWLSALKGHQTNPMKTEEDKKRLLLERFQEEVLLF